MLQRFLIGMEKPEGGARCPQLSSGHFQEGLSRPTCGRSELKHVSYLAARRHFLARVTNETGEDIENQWGSARVLGCWSPFPFPGLLVFIHPFLPWGRVFPLPPCPLSNPCCPLQFGLLGRSVRAVWAPCSRGRWWPAGQCGMEDRAGRGASCMAGRQTLMLWLASLPTPFCHGSRSKKASAGARCLPPHSSPALLLPLLPLLPPPCLAEPALFFSPLSACKVQGVLFLPCMQIKERMLCMYLFIYPS